MSTPSSISCLFAASAPVAVVFKHNTRTLVQIIKWNTDTDIFEEGQWFKGRIYINSSDISPDGTKLVYFAEKINPVTMSDREVGTHWTAVSKIPYLSALALWSNDGSEGKEKYPDYKDIAGGGKFLSDTELWLDFPAGEPQKGYIPPGFTVRDNMPHFPLVNTEGQINSQLYEFVEERNNNNRMRHGWEQVQDLKMDYIESSTSHTRTVGLRRKECPLNRCVLTRTTHEKNVHTFHVTNPNGVEFLLEKIKWADWDQQGRLVFTRDGKIFTAQLTAKGIVSRELIDLSANKFEPIEAPDWAKVW